MLRLFTGILLWSASGVHADTPAPPPPTFPYETTPSVAFNHTYVATSELYPGISKLPLRFQYSSAILAPKKQCSGQASTVWMSSKSDPAPSYTVDLGQQYAVTNFEVWNRNDCCWGRLTPFSIYITNNSSNLGTSCVNYNQPIPSMTAIDGTCNGIGRYAIIKLTGPNNYDGGSDFHLCAFQLFGSPYLGPGPSPPPPSPIPPPPSPSPPSPPSPSPSPPRPPPPPSPPPPTPPTPPSPSPPPYIPFPNTSYCPVGNPFYWTVTNTTYKTYGQMCIHTNPTNFTTIPCDFANGDNTSIGYLWNNSLKMQVFPLPANKCWGVGAGSLLVQVPCETAPTVTESPVPDFQPGNLVINGSCVTAGPLYSVVTVSPCTSPNLSQTWDPVCSPFRPPPPPIPPPPPPSPSPPPPPSPQPPPPPSPSPPPPPSPSPPPPPSPSPPPPPSPSPPPSPPTPPANVNCTSTLFANLTSFVYNKNGQQLAFANVITDNTKTNVYSFIGFCLVRIPIATKIPAVFAGVCGTDPSLTPDPVDGVGTSAVFHTQLNGFHYYPSANSMYVMDGNAVRSINLGTAQVSTLYTLPLTNALGDGNDYVPYYGCKDDVLPNIYYMMLYVKYQNLPGGIFTSVDLSNGTLTYIAGNLNQPDEPVVEGPGRAAKFSPSAPGASKCTVVGGVVYLLDGNVSNILRRVYPSTGVALNFVGNETCGTSYRAGYGSAACFEKSYGLSYLPSYNKIMYGGFFGPTFFATDLNGYQTFSTVCTGYSTGAAGFAAAAVSPNTGFYLGNSYSLIWELTVPLTNSTVFNSPPPRPPWPPTPPSPPSPPFPPPSPPSPPPTPFGCDRALLTRYDTALCGSQGCLPDVRSSITSDMQASPTLYVFAGYCLFSIAPTIGASPTILAGNPTISGNNAGNGTNARFGGAFSIQYINNYIYIFDNVYSEIWRYSIATTEVVSLLNISSLNSTWGLVSGTFDSYGNDTVYLGVGFPPKNGPGVIYQVVSYTFTTNTTRIIAGNPSLVLSGGVLLTDSYGTSATTRLSGPSRMRFIAPNYLYFTDGINGNVLRQVNTFTLQVQIILGNETCSNAPTDGFGTSTCLIRSYGLGISSTGNFIIGGFSTTSMSSIVPGQTPSTTSVKTSAACSAPAPIPGIMAFIDASPASATDRNLYMLNAASFNQIIILSPVGSNPPFKSDKYLSPIEYEKKVSYKSQKWQADEVK